jgi:ankyrin repeat protein
LKAEDELDPLMAAVESGDKEMVQLLLDNGADAKTKTKLTTPIYIAQEKGHCEIEELLIQNGAPVDPGSLWQLKRSLRKRFTYLCS